MGKDSNTSMDAQLMEMVPTTKGSAKLRDRIVAKVAYI
jgi:hypothetical protein